MFTKPARLRSPCLRDATAAAAVVLWDSTRPRAMRLAMLTVKKETLGLSNFYVWFSSVSPISIGKGLRSRPFGPAKLPHKL